MFLRWLVILAMASAAAVAQDAKGDPSAVLKDLEKKWEDLKSFRATYTSTMPAPGNQGADATAQSEGRLDMVKDKGQMKYRLDQKVSVANPDGTAASTSRTITLFDGEGTYVTTDVAGSKSVMVLSPESQASRIPLDAKALLERLREIGELTLAQEMEMGGIGVYLFEGAPLLPEGSPEANEASTMRVYVEKTTGVPIQWTIVDAKGGTVAQGAYTNIDVNVDIDPNQFVFEVPVGATVIDMPSSPPAP